MAPLADWPDSARAGRRRRPEARPGVAPVAPLRGLSWVIGGPGFLREPSIRRLSGFSRGRRTNYIFSEMGKVRTRSLEKIPSFICTSQKIAQMTHGPVAGTVLGHRGPGIPKGAFY